MVELVLIVRDAADVGHESGADEKHGNPNLATHRQSAMRKGMFNGTNGSLDRCPKVDIGGKSAVHLLAMESSEERTFFEVENTLRRTLAG